MFIKDFIQAVISGITNGAIYGLIALSFSIIYQVTEIFNFAKGQIVVLGGLLGLYLIRSFHLNPFLALLTVVIISLPLGYGIDKFAVRPVVEKSHLAVIISTVALGILIENVYLLLTRKNFLPFPNFIPTREVYIFELFINTQTFFVLGFSLFALILTALLFKYTLVGVAMRGVATNRLAATLMGIDTQKMAGFASSIAIAIAMVSGVLIAPLTYAGGPIAPYFTIKGFVAAVLGGVTNTASAYFGGILLGLLESIVSKYLSSKITDTITIGVVIVLFSIKPMGILILKRK
jgi:branched-chain amino acid transport system permease protein